jgi:[histone H4]-lysine20 N-methyltransferase SETD8
MGRMINHSRNGNALTKVKIIGNTPRLYFYAKKKVHPGQEILFDYGDRRKAQREYFPWL